MNVSSACNSMKKGTYKTILQEKFRIDKRLFERVLFESADGKVFHVSDEVLKFQKLYSILPESKYVRIPKKVHIHFCDGTLIFKSL